MTYAYGATRQPTRVWRVRPRSSGLWEAVTPGCPDEQHPDKRCLCQTFDAEKQARSYARTLASMGIPTRRN